MVKLPMNFIASRDHKCTRLVISILSLFNLGGFQKLVVMRFSCMCTLQFKQVAEAIYFSGLQNKPGNSVCTETRLCCGLRSQCSIPGRVKRLFFSFSTASRLTVEPTQPPMQFIPGVKLATHLHLASVQGAIPPHLYMSS